VIVIPLVPTTKKQDSPSDPNIGFLIPIRSFHHLATQKSGSFIQSSRCHADRGIPHQPYPIERTHVRIGAVLRGALWLTLPVTTVVSEEYVSERGSAYVEPELCRSWQPSLREGFEVFKGSGEKGRREGKCAEAWGREGEYVLELASRRVRCL